MLFPFKTGPWRLSELRHHWTNFLETLWDSDHGPKQSVGLQHRAHPLPAARTQAARDGDSSWRISAGDPRRIQPGLRKPPGPCAPPGSGAGTRLPAVPRGGLGRGVLPARSRVPSRRLLCECGTLRSLQRHRLRRYVSNVSDKLWDSVSFFYFYELK